MKNNICLFFLLLITINTSCQEKWGINMQTKESSENYMLTELEKTYGVKEDPAFVRSPFHNIGHAQGNEELSERDLYKIARELNEEHKEKLRNGR